MQIKLTVKGQKLTIAQETIAEQTINYLEAEASFSSEWDNLVKFAHFTKAGCGEEENYVIELVNDKITKDKHLNLSKGEWIVSLHGNEIVGDEVVERITTTIAQLYVKATGYLNGEPLPITPPSVGEQILAKVLEANTRSKAAKQESSEALKKVSVAITKSEEVLEEAEKALVDVRAYDTKINEALTNSQEALETSNKTKEEVNAKLNKKQNNLVSGVNIKTINNESILGGGNIEIEWEELEDKPFENIDNNTLKVENNVLKVDVVDEASEDNTKPISSSGVKTIVGNIDSLLSLI